MNKKKLLVLIVTLVIFGFIFYKIDFVKVVETFKNFNSKYLIHIVILYITTLVLRGFRWKYLLNNDNKYSVLDLAKVFTVGSMLNSFVPARAGDLYRAYYLGSVAQENKVKIFGSVILERIFDGVSVFVILMLTVANTFASGLILKLTYATGVLFLGSLILFYLLVKFHDNEPFINRIEDLIHRLPQKIEAFAEKLFKLLTSFVDGFRVLENSTNAIVALAFSFGIWLIEAFIAYMLIISFGFKIDFYSGLYVMALTSFSTVIPSASVFLGPYQIAYILALGIFGIGKSQAIAVSAVHQGIFMIILAVIGIFYLIKFNVKLSDVKEFK